MTGHLCTSFDPSCYRCALSRDEVKPPYRQVPERAAISQPDVADCEPSHV